MDTWVGTRNGGSCVPADEARISVLDHGFTVADGVFETLKIVDGKVFALQLHLERLAASAAGLLLPEPDPEVIRAAVAQMLRSNADEIGSFGRLRITYTGGAGPLGSDRGDVEPTLVIATSQTKTWPAATSIALVPWTRNERSAIAGLKSTSYAENVVALALAHRWGASEAVLTNTRDELCEGTGSNLFAVVQGRLVTPPLSSGCLAGITRELVLRWAREDGLEVSETAMDVAVLADADELFLTSSTRDVHPIEKIVGEQGVLRTLPSHPVTTHLRDLFAERSADPSLWD